VRSREALEDGIDGHGLWNALKSDGLDLEGWYKAGVRLHGSGLASPDVGKRVPALSERGVAVLAPEAREPGPSRGTLG
jgi:hypothetical protein